MKVFVIDIYTQIWDGEGLWPVEDRHLKTVSYQIDIEVKDFSEELSYLIATELGNGYSFTIYEFNKIVFVRTEIFFREKHDFILDYLKRIGVETSYPDLEQDTSTSLIQLPVIQREEREVLKAELEQRFGRNIKISDSEMIYEKGFSNWDANLLIWLDDIQISIVSMYIYDFLNKRLPLHNTKVNKIYNYTDNEILQMISERSGVNQNNLKLIDYKFNDEDKSSIYYITSRYVDISLKINEEKEIISYQENVKTQSRI